VGSLVLGPGLLLSALFRSVVLFPESIHGFAPFSGIDLGFAPTLFMVMLIISLATSQLASLDVLRLSYFVVR
jgi:hypothetical protein